MSLLTGYKANICTTQSYGIRSKTRTSKSTSLDSSFTSTIDVSCTLRNMSVITRICETHALCSILPIMSPYGSSNLCTTTWNNRLVTTLFVTGQTIDSSSPPGLTIPVKDACKPSNIYDAVRTPVTCPKPSPAPSQPCYYVPKTVKS